MPHPWFVASALSLAIPVSGRLSVERSRAGAALSSEWARVAEEEIRSLVGLSPTAPATLIATLSSSGGRENATLAESNPTLIRLRSEYEVAELILLREIRKQYPDLQLGPSFKEDQAQSRIGVIGVIPIPVLNSNKGEYASGHDDFDIHMMAPDPLPEGVKWWVELEKPDGTRALGSIAPKR